MSVCDIKELAEKIDVLSLKKGGVLIEVGAIDNTTLYLIEGSIQLIAKDGRKKKIQHTDSASASPISRLRPSRYKAQALTPIKYLSIKNELLITHEAFEEDSSLLLNSYLQDEADCLIDEDKNELLVQLRQALKQGALFVPLIQKQAEPVCHRIVNGRLTPEKKAELMMLSPGIIINLLCLNDKQKSPVNPESHGCLGIIDQVNSKRFDRMLVNTLFRASVQSNDLYINHALKSWWEHSIRVSKVSALLAQTSDLFNEECAAIYGLLHGIGEGIILGFCHNPLNTINDIEEVESLIATSSNDIGVACLRYWGLPKTLIAIVAESRNWSLENKEKDSYQDLILIAQHFVEQNTSGVEGLPRLDQIPAYHRLSLDKMPKDVAQKISELLVSEPDKSYQTMVS